MTVCNSTPPPAEPQPLSLSSWSCAMPLGNGHNSQRDCQQAREGHRRGTEFVNSDTMANHETQQQQHQRPRQHRRSKARHAAARPAAPARFPLRLLLRVASVAGGIQFGCARQLSLLTPYVQQLGISHVWASIIWLYGPLSGLLVQPLVGHLSDGCTSRFGRRRPSILGGALSIVVAVLIIGHSADIG